MHIKPDLISKYDGRLPRYTSYPPATAWNDEITHEQYSDLLGSIRGSIAIYLHFPFCRKRCTFCGCNAIPTRNRAIIDRYIYALSDEIKMISSSISNGEVESVHFGGGSPDYIPHRAVRMLLDEIRDKFSVSSGAEISIELDPAQVGVRDVVQLKALGFNRISFGVQDFSPEVVTSMGRKSDAGLVSQLVDIASDVGFRGVAVDLIYGLPRQTEDSMRRTIDSVISMDPHRVALFNFAYLPKILPHQRAIRASELPSPFMKVRMVTLAKGLLESAGFVPVGLDHFARMDDSLTLALKSGTLVRNFQGYTSRGYDAQLGFGTTAIGFLKNTYAQNEKKLNRYLSSIEKGRCAITRGTVLSQDDVVRGKIINALMCFGEANISDDAILNKELAAHMYEDGLITLNDGKLKVTRLGHYFLRNVASLFDRYAHIGTYSKSV